MKISKDAHSDIIDAYTIDLWPLQEIADVLHVSKQAIYQVLIKHGIDTSKHKIPVSCTVCGATIERTRKRVRTQLNHFCTTDCYSAYLAAGKGVYVGNRHGQRIARTVVAQHFNIQPEHVVHHEDRNQLNNMPSNLRVFANQGDHIRYHHQARDEHFNKITSPIRSMQVRYRLGNDIEPIWTGEDH